VLFGWRSSQIEISGVDTDFMPTPRQLAAKLQAGLRRTSFPPVETRDNVQDAH